jgi:hypothetical protein
VFTIKNLVIQIRECQKDHRQSKELVIYGNDRDSPSLPHFDQSIGSNWSDRLVKKLDISKDTPQSSKMPERALAFYSRFGQKNAIAIVYIVTAFFCPFSILITRSHLYVLSKLEIRCASGILDDWGCISIITIAIVQNETK